MSEENLEETQAVEETTYETEELDLDALEAVEQVEEVEEATDAQEEIKKLKEQNTKLYARLKKASKEKINETVKTRPNNSSLTRDEAILFAKGHTDEEVDLAIKLAKVNDVSIHEATTDLIFRAKVQQRQKKEKSAKASLGASSGKSEFAPPDVGKMSRDEHIKLFNDTMGNA